MDVLGLRDLGLLEGGDEGDGEHFDLGFGVLEVEVVADVLVGYLVVVVSVDHLEGEAEEGLFVVEAEGDHGPQPLLKVDFVSVLLSDEPEQVDDAGEEKGVVVFDDEVDEVIHGEVPLSLPVKLLEHLQ